MKILVVHRQKEIIESLMAYDESLVIQYIPSGLEALLSSRIELYDLIVCSTDLPVITGFELARSIRINSINKKTPILLVEDKHHETSHTLAQSMDTTIMTLTAFTKKIPTIIESLSTVGDLTLVDKNP